MAIMLHVTIQTNRFEEEMEFYKTVVGLTLQRDLRPHKDLVFFANKTGDTCIEIIHNPDAEAAGNEYLSIGFQADDVDAKRVELVEAGYDVTPMVSPMPDVKFFFVKDPAGVSVQFI